MCFFLVLHRSNRNAGDVFSDSQSFCLLLKILYSELFIKIMKLTIYKTVVSLVDMVEVCMPMSESLFSNLSRCGNDLISRSRGSMSKPYAFYLSCYAFNNKEKFRVYNNIFLRYMRSMEKRVAWK